MVRTLDEHNTAAFEHSPPKETIDRLETCGRLERLECPVCLEEVRPPMRLRQCGEGHITCDTCYARQAGEEAEKRRCGLCRGMILGRPTVLESLMGLN